MNWQGGCRFGWVAAAILALGSCVPKPILPKYPYTPPGSFQLLTQAGPFPTEVLRTGERREDIEIRPTNHDMVPSVVAKGASPELVISQETQVTLAGNAEGTRGWSVDNAILFEVTTPKGRVIDRFVVGFVLGSVHIGAELLENVGSWSPKFGPREPNLAQRLPIDRPFILQATVIDNGNSGAISDVFLIIEKSESIVDPLREE